ncbi:hypothetical protein B0H14DRAFT_2614971 [Mycena olivaceomarginata]|nr:hypothetical protein B0H14DRAFT_2614971 [Mycena olivaceomarginata]
MLATGRDMLLSATSFVVEQRNALEDNLSAIDTVRSETAVKLQELLDQVLNPESRTDRCLEASACALRAFGSTESQLARLTQSILEYNAKSTPARPNLSPLPRTSPHASTPLDDLHEEMDANMAPRGAHESCFSRHMGPPPFDTGENVLCYHGLIIYVANIIKSAADENSTSGVHYFVRYKGWKKIHSSEQWCYGSFMRRE